MTHRSLFKEVAQRIVQSAQASQSDGSSNALPANASPMGAPGTPPTQMSASTFGAASPVTTLTDRSRALPR